MSLAVGMLSVIHTLSSWVYSVSWLVQVICGTKKFISMTQSKTPEWGNGRVNARYIQHRIDEKENEPHCERSKSKPNLCNLLGALLA